MTRKSLPVLAIAALCLAAPVNAAPDSADRGFSSTGQSAGQQNDQKSAGHQSAQAQAPDRQHSIDDTREEENKRFKSAYPVIESTKDRSKLSSFVIYLASLLGV